jgi:hypothetical protein
MHSITYSVSPMFEIFYTKTNLIKLRIEVHLPPQNKDVLPSIQSPTLQLSYLLYLNVFAGHCDYLCQERSRT